MLSWAARSVAAPKKNGKFAGALALGARVVGQGDAASVEQEEGCLPPPGQAETPGRDQLCGCIQSMKRATAWQKSSTAAFYFYCFLQHVFLFPKQKQSVQDQ